VKLNVIILGEDGVGKSALTSKFHKGNKFSKKQACSKNSCVCLVQKVDGKIVKFDILDTDETVNDYDIAQAAIVVYDITNKDSFVYAQCVIRKLRHYANSDILIALIGNKSDLESEIFDPKLESRITKYPDGFVFKKLSEIANSGTYGTIALAHEKNGDWSKRKVEYEDVSTFAEQNDLIFLETSAKKDQNVNEILMQIAMKSLREDSSESKENKFLETEL